MALYMAKVPRFIPTSDDLRFLQNGVGRFENEFGVNKALRISPVESLQF